MILDSCGYDNTIFPLVSGMLIFVLWGCVFLHGQTSWDCFQCSPPVLATAGCDGVRVSWRLSAALLAHRREYRVFGLVDITRVTAAMDKSCCRGIDAGG